ncbi:MAG: DMT family transporter [Microcoleaceae cyanobacterium]
MMRNMMQNPNMNALDWLLLLMLSMLWGSSFLFIEIALRELPPFTLIFLRISLAAMILTIFVVLRGQKLPTSPKIWRDFLTMGVLNNLIPFSLIAWGQTQIESGLAAILNATTPIFAVVLAHILTVDERLTLNRGIGVLLGFIGVVFLIGLDALKELGWTNLGQLAVLCAACFYALAGLYGRRFKMMSPMVTAAGILIGTTVMLLPIMLIIDRPWDLNPSMQAKGSILILAVFGTAIAYLIYFKLLARVGATNALLVAFLIPVTALFLGIFFLGETLRWNAWVSLGLILTGLAVIDGRGIRIFNPARTRKR